MTGLLSDCTSAALHSESIQVSFPTVAVCQLGPEVNQHGVLFLTLTFVKSSGRVGAALREKYKVQKHKPGACYSLRFRSLKIYILVMSIK